MDGAWLSLLALGTRTLEHDGRLGIYADLLTLGVEAALARHRAQSSREIPSEVATIGEWIEAARGVSASNAATFAQYAASLRLIAGQILSVKKTKKRFGPGKGGAQAYRAGIDASVTRNPFGAGRATLAARIRGAGQESGARAFADDFRELHNPAGQEPVR